MAMKEIGANLGAIERMWKYLKKKEGGI